MLNYMMIIVDGYNVLKTIHATSHITDHEREQFIHQLAHYAKLSHNKIFIVFDGGEDIRPTFYPRSGIIVIYSGYRDTADDVIKNLVDREQHRDVMLVSTDRELNRYAAELDVPSIDSTVFYGHLQDRLKSEEYAMQQQKKVDIIIRKRLGHESSEEVDALMMGDVGKVLQKHEDEKEYNNYRCKKHKTSKEEKKLEKMVKKL